MCLLRLYEHAAFASLYQHLSAMLIGKHVKDIKDSARVLQ